VPSIVSSLGRFLEHPAPTFKWHTGHGTFLSDSGELSIANIQSQAEQMIILIGFS
jgi:hypothetical protein